MGIDDRFQELIDIINNRLKGTPNEKWLIQILPKTKLIVNSTPASTFSPSSLHHVLINFDMLNEMNYSPEEKCAAFLHELGHVATPPKDQINREEAEFSADDCVCNLEFGNELLSGYLKMKKFPKHHNETQDKKIKRLQDKLN